MPTSTSDLTAPTNEKCTMNLKIGSNGNGRDSSSSRGRDIGGYDYGGRSSNCFYIYSQQTNHAVETCFLKHGFSQGGLLHQNKLKD